MKILTCDPAGAFSYILNGINSALRLAGNNVDRVIGKAVPDTFDLYIGCSGWRQTIPAKNKRAGKVGIHVNPYGIKRVGGVDGGPIIDESQDAIKWTLAQNPDFVFCYCSDTFTNEYFGYWTTKHGIPVVGMPTAADITIYKPRNAEDRFKCEIGWVGGRWPYKAIMMDKYLSPLFSKKCLIYGWGKSWPNKPGFHNVMLPDVEVSTLFSSAKICPSVSESHTSVHPIDVPERVFKVPAAGGFTIHTPSPAIKDLFGDTIPMAKNVTEWLELINHYLSHDNLRIDLAKKQRKLILDKHTYFDRCVGIAKIINNNDLVNKLLEAKQRLI